jgi:tetratricopeptide (TPR) repeat protein
MLYNYGIALMKTGREQDAERVFSNLLTETRARGEEQWEARLLKLIADLDFGLGNYSAARSRYEELDRVYREPGSQNNWAEKQLRVLNYVGSNSEEIRAYGALLLGYLCYNSRRDGFTVVQLAKVFQQQYPTSVVAVNVDEISRKADEEAEKWFADLLDRVDTLSGQQKNQEAIQLIEQIPADILPLDKQAILNLKKKTLTASLFIQPGSDTIQEEILLPDSTPGSAGTPDDSLNVGSENTGTDGNTGLENSEQAHVPVAALQETWDQGMAYMQAKEYDRAIDVFNGLLNTSLGSEAGLQLEEASRLAAREDRKKAAELFVRAGSTTDPVARRELLLSSRVLLEDILRKYPRAGLEDKVRRNLSRIDQELGAIE